MFKNFNNGISLRILQRIFIFTVVMNTFEGRQKLNTSVYQE
jgi:hypothetical protein